MLSRAASMSRGMLIGKREDGMLSEWIKCVSRDDNSTVVYVNMAHATTVFQHGGGSRICFVGDAEDHADVKESPELILAMLQDEKNASRD